MASLLEKAHQKKQVQPEKEHPTEKTQQPGIQKTPSLLDKAKQRKQPPKFVDTTHPDAREKTIQEIQTLLEKVQQKRAASPIQQEPFVILKESADEPTSLLTKAQQRKLQTHAVEKPHIAIPEPKKGVTVEVIEEEDGFGWQHMGKKRIVFDHAINDYRYELIEPELTDDENDIKKELSHLFKMLADIDTFDMTHEEKEKFLTDTLENIIIDNDIRFDQPRKHYVFKDTEQQKEQEPSSKQKPHLFKKHEPEEMRPPQLDEQSKEKIYYHLFRDFLGYGRIDILMHDGGIEDISCDGPDTPIFLHHRKYESIETNIFFGSEAELNSFVVRLCQVSGQQISIYAPIVDGKLPDGSRLQATLARTVTKGSTFTIRKFKDDPLTPIDLINYKSMSTDMAVYFWTAIEHGASILFCGGTASGKTSALNALLLFVPGTHKIVSIEDTREVNIPHQNWIAGTTRKGFATTEDSKTGKDIDMFDLIRAALRQRPRVIIVGEVRGREAYSLFQAMATGHTAYATVHASTIHTLIQRLENPPISLPRALLTSLEIIVFQNAVNINEKMVRRMTSVTEIIKLDSDTNQLIFMAPFTWLSKTDDRFESSRTSKIYNQLKQQNDWSDEELEQELNNRKFIIEWMVENNIHDYRQFSRIIEDYRKFPEQTLKSIEWMIKNNIHEFEDYIKTIDFHIKPPEQTTDTIPEDQQQVQQQEDNKQPDPEENMPPENKKEKQEHNQSDEDNKT